MHDLRSAPRWSKTAVVVVLVVFGLVLVVGVFGFLTFRADREVRQGRARDRAKVDASGLLEEVHDSINNRLGVLLEEAAERNGRMRTRPVLAVRVALRNFMQGGTGDGAFVEDLFQIAKEETVLWLGAHFRMHESPAVLAAEATRQAVKAKTWALMPSESPLDLAREARKRHGVVEALGAWREVVAALGLLVDRLAGEDEAHAVGLGFAVQMLKAARDAVELDPQNLDETRIRNVLLAALEANSLNRGRTELNASSLSAYSASLRAEMDSLLDMLPRAEQDILTWEVDRFRHTRNRAEALLADGMLANAVRKVQRRGSGHFVVFEEALEEGGFPIIFGIVHDGGERPALIVRLDYQAVERYIRESIAKRRQRFLDLGMRAAVYRHDEDHTEGGIRPHTDLLATMGRDFELPFQLVFDRIGDPREYASESTDLLFWVVIALAMAGLGVGGHVLVRLLTREVRLARLKADFVSNLSHELKTPITGISLFTEMLEGGKMTDPADQAEAYSILAAESQRLQGTVARMIEVARGEARSTPFDLHPGDLIRPVLAAATRLRRIVTEPGLNLTIDLSPTPLSILLDESSMDDVVTNLLSNAWKYRRGEEARISIRTARRGRYAQVVVSDDGIGIPRSERRKIFEMFYRAEQYLTQPVAGTGLGLALVRSIVAGHKGRVRVESGEGGVSILSIKTVSGDVILRPAK